MRIDVHYVSMPKPGETANGDAVVLRRDETLTLVAVIDALGHGAGAAATAAAAVDYLESISPIPSVPAIMEGLHQRMQHTRGAAILLCAIEPTRLVGCSVGNVELRSRRGSVPTVLTPGVVGSRLRNPRTFESALTKDERIVIFTDGMSSRLSARDVDGLAGEEACRALMRMHQRKSDDATVVLVDVIH